MVQEILHAIKNQKYVDLYISHLHTHAFLPFFLLKYLRTDLIAVPMTTMTTVRKVYTNTDTLTTTRTQTLGRTHRHMHVQTQVCRLQQTDQQLRLQQQQWRCRSTLLPPPSPSAAQPASPLATSRLPTLSLFFLFDTHTHKVTEESSTHVRP